MTSVMWYLVVTVTISRVRVLSVGEYVRNVNGEWLSVISKYSCTTQKSIFKHIGPLVDERNEYQLTSSKCDIPSQNRRAKF